MSPHERREAQAQLLAESVERLTTQEGFAAWLGVRKRFASYSFSNQLLIVLQAPDARMVAGYRAWQKVGRQVRYQEQGIRILAPCRYTVEDDDGERRPVVRGFKLVSVFDIAQTDGAEPPEALLEVSFQTGGQTEQLPALEAVCSQLGYSLARATSESDPILAGGAQGYCHHGEQRIVLRGDLDHSDATRVLVHELIHALHEQRSERQLTRADEELVTDAAAAIVCSGIGVDSHESTAQYLAHWSDGSVERVKALLPRAVESAETLELYLQEAFATSDA